MRHVKRFRQSNTLRSALAAYGIPEAPSREHIEYVTNAILVCAQREYCILGDLNPAIEHNPTTQLEDTANGRSTLCRLPASAGSRFVDSSVAPIHPRRRTNVADFLAEALELSD